MKDAYYFPHDSNARNDPKMLSLKMKYKTSGIGMFWILIEILRDQDGFKYPIENYSWGSLSAEFLTTPEKAEQFIYDCINEFQLLRSDGKFFWSDSLIKRMQRMIDERSKRSAAGKKGMESRWGNKPDENNNVITPLYHSNNVDITADNKGNEKKVNERKGNRKEKIVSEDPSHEIVNFRLRYSDFLSVIDSYFDILRTTRVSGKISDSIMLKVYQEMDKYLPVIVKYACMTVVNKPDLHSKKENYLYGIMRNTTADEAVAKIIKYENQVPSKQNSSNPEYNKYSNIDKSKFLAPGTSNL